MHVFRFFLNTLLLVAAVVSGVLGFIYRDEVMQKAAALSGTVMTLLHEQGWLATSPVAKQAAVAEPPAQVAPAPTEPVSEVIRPLAELPPLATVPPPVSEITKADYPPENYVPAGPEVDAKNVKNVKKRITEAHDPLPMDSMPPGEPGGGGMNVMPAPEKGRPPEGQGGQIPQVGPLGQMPWMAQLPHAVRAGEGQSTSAAAPDFIPSMANNNFAGPLGGFPSPPLTEEANVGEEAGTVPYPSSLPPYERGESRVAQGASRGAGGAEGPHPFPWFSQPPFFPPSARDHRQEEGGSDEARMAQTVPPWIRPSLGGPRPSPSMPSRPATGEPPHPQASAARNQQPPVVLREAWITARRAFWEQDPSVAEKAYQALIRDYPDEPDLPGELGNIYLHQGRWPEAADLYYEAGLRTMRSSNRGRVGAVIRILRSLDPAKAEALRQKMTAGHAPG